MFAAFCSARSCFCEIGKQRHPNMQLHQLQYMSDIYIKLHEGLAFPWGTPKFTIG